MNEWLRNDLKHYLFNTLTKNSSPDIISLMQKRQSLLEMNSFQVKNLEKHKYGFY